MNYEELVDELFELECDLAFEEEFLAAARESVPPGRISDATLERVAWLKRKIAELEAELNSK